MTTIKMAAITEKNISNLIIGQANIRQLESLQEAPTS